MCIRDRIISRLNLAACGQQQREANQRYGDTHDIGQLVGHAEAHRLLKTDIHGAHGSHEASGHGGNPMELAAMQQVGGRSPQHDGGEGLVGKSEVCLLYTSRCV